MRLVIVHCLNPLSSPPHATRVLIIRLGALGDVVRTLPALRAIPAAYPDAQISWLVEKGASGVLEGRRELDCVIQFPRENLTDSLRTLALENFGGNSQRLCKPCARSRSISSSTFTRFSRAA